MNKKRMIVKTVKVENLSKAQIEEMWNLYSNSYDNVKKHEFETDLSEKSHVFIGLDKETKQFKGFSTFLVYEVDFKNEKIGVIFSGDTMVDQEYWGNKTLNVAFIKYCYLWKIRNFGKKLYWNLIASGNKTYLVMARHATNYYPRYDQPTPSWENEFINFIGKLRFKGNFCEKTGIIRLGKVQPVLKSHIAPFNNQVMSLPEISFFVEKNPGYHEGDELSCIAEINLSTFFNVFTKALRKKLPLVTLRRQTALK